MFWRKLISFIYVVFIATKNRRISCDEQGLSNISSCLMRRANIASLVTSVTDTLPPLHRWIMMANHILAANTQRPGENHQYFATIFSNAFYIWTIWKMEKNFWVETNELCTSIWDNDEKIWHILVGSFCQADAFNRDNMVIDKPTLKLKYHFNEINIIGCTENC